MPRFAPPRENFRVRGHSTGFEMADRGFHYELPLPVASPSIWVHACEDRHSSNTPSAAGDRVRSPSLPLMPKIIFVSPAVLPDALEIVPRMPSERNRRSHLPCTFQTVPIPLRCAATWRAATVAPPEPVSTATQGHHWRSLCPPLECAFPQDRRKGRAWSGSVVRNGIRVGCSLRVSRRRKTRSGSPRGEDRSGSRRSV